MLCFIITQTLPSCTVNLWNTDTGVLYIHMPWLQYLLCYDVESSRFTIILLLVQSWESYVFVATPIDCVYTCMYHDHAIIALHVLIANNRQQWWTWHCNNVLKRALVIIGMLLTLPLQIMLIDLSCNFTSTYLERTITCSLSLKHLAEVQSYPTSRV